MIIFYDLNFSSVNCLVYEFYSTNNLALPLKGLSNHNRFVWTFNFSMKGVKFPLHLFGQTKQWDLGLTKEMVSVWTNGDHSLVYVKALS